MTTGAQVSITVQARDAASGTFQKLGRELGQLNQQANNMRRAMSGLNFALGVAGIGSVTFLAANAIRGTVQSMFDAHRASANLQTRMILMGFGVDQSRRAVQTLNSSLNLTAMAGMRNLSDESIALMGQLSGPTREAFFDLAEQMSGAGGGSVADAFDAITKAQATLTDTEFAAWVELQRTAIKAWRDELGPTQKAWMVLKEEWDRAMSGIAANPLSVLDLIQPGFTEGLDTIIVAIGQFVGNAQQWAMSLPLAMWGAIMDGWVALKAWWKDSALKGLIDEVEKLPGVLKIWGLALIRGLWDGIKERWAELATWWQSDKDALQMIGDVVRAAEADWRAVGVFIIDGISGGMISRLSAIRRAAEAAVRAIKDAFGVHSPSTVGFDIGRSLSQGMELGFGRGNSSGGMRLQAPLNISLGGTRVGGALVTLMGDQMSLRAPGLGQA